MRIDLGIRTKIAGAAAIATVSVLSLVGTVGYLAMIRATRESQIELLNDRLDELEEQLESSGGQLVGRIQIDSSLRVIREGQPMPAAFPQTLRVVRTYPDPGIEAFVGVIDTSRIDATFSTIRIGLWISVLTTGLVVGAITWIVVDRALSPVRRLTRQAEANMANRSLEPVSIDDGRDEITELASTFNAMLRRLRTADVERRRFVSDASHELRTPLMVLSADAEYALDDPANSDPSTEELARTVLFQSDRLTSLVDDLLTLASLDEQQSVTVSDVSVTDVVASADLTSAVHDLPRSVGGLLIPDISRSLANIAANARRHQTDKIVVLVDVDKQTNDGETKGCDSKFVRFIIDDDGPGIPRSEREEIFKRFYRPDQGRNRNDGGAGLGLAIVEAQVTQAGGRVIVDDNPLGGARFIVTVPVQQDQGPLSASFDS